MAVITHRLTGPGHMDNVSNVFWEENVVNTSIAVGSIPIGVAARLRWSAVVSEVVGSVLGHCLPPPIGWRPFLFINSLYM